MKKRFIITSASTLALTVLTVSGIIMFSTKSTATPELNGYDKAISTITSQYGNVTAGKDYTVKATVRNILTPNTEGNNDELLTTVERLSDTNVSVLFCLADDSVVIEATDCERSFVSNYVVDLAYKEDKFHNEKNYAKGSLAYRYNDEISAIITEEADFECSSIWAFNVSSNQVSLIWADENNENWAQYGK